MKPESLRMRQWRNANKKPCPDCGKLINPDSSICAQCSRNKRGIVHQESTTIGEYRRKISVSGKHPSWLHSHIRGMARYKHKELCRGGCMNCGYCKHVEICHIKALADFSDESFISTVNAVENILVLCRNCHWELDHELLISTEIKASVAQRIRASIL